MRSLTIVAVGVLLVAGCSSDPAPKPAKPAPVAVPVAVPDAAAAAVPDAAMAAVPVAVPDAATAAVAVPDVAAVVLTPQKDWPFHKWDRAEAVTFNQVQYGPGIPLMAYSAEDGWNPKIADRKAIDAAQAKRAADWTIATTGEVEVSKCAFPRHAIVFYAGDTPVGTTNVCFECGDILVWPDFEPKRDYENESAAEAKKWEKKYKKKLGVYEKVFPQWEKFFRDELGLSIEPPPRPR
jgi:hypothetical protein